MDVGVQFVGDPSRVATVAPLLDTGAEMSIFDGRVAEAAGLSWQEVVRRALDLSRSTGSPTGTESWRGTNWRSPATWAPPFASPSCASGVLITPPDTIALPVLGRAGFFEQVDVTFAKLEKVLYLRFRDPALRRAFE